MSRGTLCLVGLLASRAVKTQQEREAVEGHKREHEMNEGDGPE